MEDATLSLCLPPGFVAAGRNAWARPGPDSQGAPTGFLGVTLLRLPQDSAAFSPWPPVIAGTPPSCAADCLRVDSVVVHHDALAGYAATTTTALLSGGFAGFRRRPTLVSGWIVSDSLRILVQGWSSLPATLDTLRMALRTVSVPR